MVLDAAAFAVTPVALAAHAGAWPIAGSTTTITTITTVTTRRVRSVVFA